MDQGHVDFPELEFVQELQGDLGRSVFRCDAGETDGGTEGIGVGVGNPGGCPVAQRPFDTAGFVFENLR